MAKYRYFELDEFIRSDTAEEKGIDNTPTFAVVEHLGELVEKILDPLRAAYGKPIRVNSGYRCEKLNRAVGGVTNSAHTFGYAADLLVSENFDAFKSFVADWVKASGARFDQVLLEKNKNGEEWIHIGLYNKSGQQRGQIKVLNV